MFRLSEFYGPFLSETSHYNFHSEQRVLILAIETASPGGSVAALDFPGTQCDGVVAAEVRLEPTSAARTLAMAISDLLARVGASPQEVNLIAVATGPGSFTGLRVGVTTAKTLAYALGCDLVGVDTLDVIAARMPAAVSGNIGGAELHAVMDAQRRELFLARYRCVPDNHSETDDDAALVCCLGRLRRLEPTVVVAAESWLAQLGPSCVVTGPALQRWVARLPSGVRAAAAEAWNPTAETVGRLAYAAWRLGRRDDPFRLVPTYIRPSYADEKVQ